MRAAGLGYHYPVVWGADQNRVWNLRKAALGLLANIPGDAKPVAVIEDTAIDPEDMPAYVREFDEILAVTISPLCITDMPLRANCICARS